ncbi:hypothetical protein AVEN_224544-1 [Araneus ventricosus]|uniref:Uncharacterized protein n=1 Tax=Araneus ventricosus TaxID=182803 RepID=A0A4Y2PYH7_ARAVE|nr:hypothetical protein AVEN_224544-1 [Araneus ventricosus]
MKRYESTDMIHHRPSLAYCDPPLCTAMMISTDITRLSGATCTFLWKVLSHTPAELETLSSTQHRCKCLKRRENCPHRACLAVFEEGKKIPAEDESELLNLDGEVTENSE